MKFSKRMSRFKWVFMLIFVVLVISGCIDGLTLPPTETSLRTRPSATQSPEPIDEIVSPTSTIPIIPTETINPPTPTDTPTSLLPTLTPAPTLLPVNTGRIAFIDVKNHQISMIHTNGDFLGTVTDVGYYDNDAMAWSPDGRWIAFGNHPAEDGEIYMIRPDGSELERITFAPHNKSELSWSWDGKYIAYSDDGGTGFENDIVVLDVDTRETRKLTYTSGIEGFPAWSPNGKLIAFLYREELFSQVKLFVMSADGSDRQLITDDIPIVLTHLSWSPDGKQIAFTSGEKGCGQIYVVNLEDGELTPLTNLLGCVRSSTWSPDGRHIAFSASAQKNVDFFERDWQIYIMNADGSGAIQLTTDPGKVPLFLYWAPAPAMVIDANYAITEAGNNLNLRETSALGSTILRELETGEIITIMEGPVGFDNYYWWRIRTSDGVEGWVVEVAGWYSLIE